MLLSGIRERAESGDAFGQALLGFLFEHGMLVTPDEDVARKWYERSAEQDFAPAQYALFALLENDHPEDAHEWLCKAADSGYPAAQYILASRQMKGTGPVKADTKLAFRSMTHAADAGYRPALRGLAMMYEDGVGVEANPEIARTYLLKAAQGGDSVAAVMLGERLLARDDKDAISEGLRWIYSAAKNAEPTAFAILARVYQEGLYGIKEDRKAAELFESLNQLQRPGE